MLTMSTILSLPGVLVQVSQTCHTEYSWRGRNKECWIWSCNQWSRGIIGLEVQIRLGKGWDQWHWLTLAKKIIFLSSFPSPQHRDSQMCTSNLHCAVPSSPTEQVGVISGLKQLMSPYSKETFNLLLSSIRHSVGYLAPLVRIGQPTLFQCCQSISKQNTHCKNSPKGEKSFYYG